MPHSKLVQPPKKPLVSSSDKLKEEKKTSDRFEVGGFGGQITDSPSPCIHEFRAARSHRKE